MKWNYLSKNKPQNIEEVRQILLKNRNITDSKSFFQIKNPLDLSLKEVEIDGRMMKSAVDRIKKAIKNHENVIIFGDYDADGICATAILWETLRNMGLTASPFIPHREKHGYGLSNNAIDEILKGEKPDLIITVDNGIVAHQPILRLKSEKIDVILTDHHQAEEILPEADVIIHSTKLCGASVAWMLARELDPNFVEKVLDLAGIATISDLVPLIDANRSFAHHGIKAISRNKRPGLMALIVEAGVDTGEIDSNSIGFSIGPRINAMGRLAHGLDALRLLVTKNKEKAFTLAKLLNSTNVKRQDLTYELYKQIDERSIEWQDQHLIFFASSEIHEGVMGLIAGKLTEKYSKPAIVLSLGAITTKASARSIHGVNIVEMIRMIKADLLEAGGHPMAAGFGVLTDKVELIKQKLLKIALDTIKKEDLIATLEIDAELPSNLLSEELIKMTQEFSPFGQMNLQPVFAVKNLEVKKIFLMGTKKQHIKITVVNKEGKEISCIFWNKASLADELTSGTNIDVAGIAEINKWNGSKSLQIMGKDLHIT